MKLAVSTYSLWPWCSSNGRTLEDALGWIADAGVGAVEFAGLDETGGGGSVERAGQLRQRCDRLGLKIVGYNIGEELLVGPGEQRKAVEQLKLEVDAAAALGVPGMRHDVTRGPKSDDPSPPTESDIFARVVPAIREVADHARRRGLKSSVENHGFYLQYPVPGRAAAEGGRAPNFGLTLDMGNFLCVNEDPGAGGQAAGAVRGDRPRQGLPRAAEGPDAADRVVRHADRHRPGTARSPGTGSSTSPRTPAAGGDRVRGIPGPGIRGNGGAGRGGAARAGLPPRAVESDRGFGLGGAGGHVGSTVLPLHGKYEVTPRGIRKEPAMRNAETPTGRARYPAGTSSRPAPVGAAAVFARRS